jgi:hypothetical protein
VLGKTVKRIWDDKGGLAKFDERGLKDAIERGEEMDAEEDPEEEAKREQEEREGVDRFKDGITLEQMKELKVEIEDRLGWAERASFFPSFSVTSYSSLMRWTVRRQATHALGNFHHILTLLLPSSLTNLPNPNLAHLLPPHIPLEPLLPSILLLDASQQDHHPFLCPPSPTSGLPSGNGQPLRNECEGTSFRC